MITGHVWKLYVGEDLIFNPIQRDWKTLKFERSMSSDPTKCVLTIKYYSDINYFDFIKITSKTASSSETTEWYGYVEKRSILWNKEGRYLQIEGRDRRVILWKKWNERFVDTRLNGFFGSVSAIELLKFILRCPISDSPLDDGGISIPNHKIGWGVQPNKWVVQASPTVDTTKPEFVKSRVSGLVWRNRGTPYNNVKLDVNGVTAGGTPWTKVGGSPYIYDAGSEPEESNKVSSNTVGAYDDYNFANLPAPASAINVVKLYFWLKCDSSIIPWYNAAGTVYIWQNSTNSWLEVGTWFSGAWISASWRLIEVDVTDALGSISDVNNAKVRFMCGGNELSSHITYAYLAVNYTTDGSQEVGDYFTVNFSEQQMNVMGILIESRKSSDQYARNYNLQYSNLANPDPTNDSHWSNFPDGSINITSNTYRDILHSWRPLNLRHLRIKITIQNTSYGWEISQIYVYRADEFKYRVLLEGLSQPPKPPPYQGGPYLTDFIIQDIYSPPLIGVNISFSRITDAIDAIVERAHQNYVPYQYWINHDTGALYFCQRKGSDKSGTISFVKGTHLGGTTKEDYVGSSVQRAKVVGKSESKKQDDISSDWQINSTELDNVRTFFEEIISKKTVSSKIVADLLANIHQKEFGPVEETITCDVENDPYDPMVYDVDDDVMIIDSLTGISGAKRIQSLGKEIDSDGEHITLYLGTRWKDINDEWSRINKKLKELALTGTAIEDWLAEGSGQSKMDADAETETFEKDARNDEEEGAKDKNDMKWTKTNDGSSGQEFNCGDRWFSFRGTNVNGTQRYVQAVIKNYDQAGNVITTTLDRNPKLVFEFKIFVGVEGSNTYPEWRTSDQFEVHFGTDALNPLGIGFRITKNAGAGYALQAYLNDNVSVKVVKLQDVFSNKKYRIEAVTDWEGKIVKYYVQDPDNLANKELEFRALLAIANACSPTFLMYPLRMRLTTQTAPTPATWDKVYIYKFISEWKAKQ